MNQNSSLLLRTFLIFQYDKVRYFLTESYEAQDDQGSFVQTYI